LEKKSIQLNTDLELEKKLEEAERTIISLKVKLEETKKVEEILIRKHKEKEDMCQEREAEIVVLRKRLNETAEQMRTNTKFEKSTMDLDNILNCQTSPHDKTELGYDDQKKCETGESYKPPKKEDEQEIRSS